MTRFVSILGLLALAACSSKDGDTSGLTDGDADGIPGDTCDVEGVAVAILRALDLPPHPNPLPPNDANL